MDAAMWTTWTVTPDRIVVELDERVTPPGAALELDLRLGPLGIQRATWRLEDGRPLRSAPVGVA
jgi:hypothetical protein